MKFEAFRNVALSACVLVTALAGSGCMTPQETQDYDFTMAVDYMQDGYNELDAVADDWYKGADSAAEWHFNKALNDFSQAFAYFSKLQLPANEKQGLKDLQTAFTALQLCVKALDKNETDKAQEYYTQAETSFQEADFLLNSPNS